MASIDKQTGSVAGAAIGTAIFPGVGTAVGGLLGGLFGKKKKPPPPPPPWYKTHRVALTVAGIGATTLVLVVVATRPGK